MMIDDEESTTTAVGILEAGNGQVLSLAKMCSFHVFLYVTACFQPLYGESIILFCSLLLRVEASDAPQM